MTEKLWSARVGIALYSLFTAGCPGNVDGQPRVRPVDLQRSDAPTATPSKPQFVRVGDEDKRPVKPIVVGALEQAKTDGRHLIVYVGATWCKPCEKFHHAVESGQLDEALAGVRFLEFDADRDRNRLVADGYDGRLIPRFTVPRPDGGPSDQSVEGGIKGVGAVDFILKRLEPLMPAQG